MMDLLHYSLANVDSLPTWASHGMGMIQADHIQLGHIQLGHIQLGHGLLPDDWATIATQFKETNISGDIGKWWDKAVKTGQVWAFLLGAIFGYLLKTFTTYG
jgi:hypothetical protein